MPTLDEHAAQRAIKLLGLGDSGTGKTRSLASLANSGRYRLFIHDFDNGLDVLRPFVKPEFHKNIFFRTYASETQFIGDTVHYVKGAPEAWSDFRSMLSDWVEPDGTSYGSIYALLPTDIIVIDSLSFAAKAALEYVVATNSGRDALKLPHPTDWGDVSRHIEHALKQLYSPKTQANVIVLTHIDKQNEPVRRMFQTKDTKEQDRKNDAVPERWLPLAAGKVIQPIIPRYFNNMVLYEIDQLGKYEIHFEPRPEVRLNLKLATSSLRSPLSTETGLLEIFDAILPEKKD